MHHSNGMQLKAMSSHSKLIWWKGDVKRNGKLLDDSGSVVRWLNPRHVKGWDRQTQIQSLPGMMAEAGNRDLFLSTGGQVWEAVWSPGPSPEQHKVSSLLPRFPIASLGNTHNRVRTLSSRYLGTIYTSLHLSLKDQAPPSLTIPSGRYLLSISVAGQWASPKEV